MHLFLKLLCGSVLLLLSATARAQAPLLNTFPQCDYQVLDTVIETRKFTHESTFALQNELPTTFALMVEKFRQRANEIGADAIILIDRELFANKQKKGSKIRQSTSRISYTAELVKLCTKSNDIALRITPFNNKGEPQKKIKLGGSMQIEHQFEIGLPGNKKRNMPTLASVEVSLSSGLYGAVLGSSYSQVTERFGTPTFDMRVNQSQRIIAYGRKHWLVFEHNQLVQATSRNTWFSNEFVNLLAFDERFEKQPWSIAGKIKENDSLAKALSLLPIGQTDSKKLSLKGDQAELELLIDYYHDHTGKIAKRYVVGFDLHVVGYQSPSLPNTDLSDRVIVNIQGYLNDPNDESLNVEKLGVPPLATAYVDSASSLLLYGANLVVEQTGNTVSKLRFLENVYQGASAASPWTFMQTSRDQPLDMVLDSLGDEAFHMDDLVEISGDNFSQNMYFYEADGEMRLLTSEVTIY